MPDVTVCRCKSLVYRKGCGLWLRRGGILQARRLWVHGLRPELHHAHPRQPGDDERGGILRFFLVFDVVLAPLDRAQEPPGRKEASLGGGGGGHRQGVFRGGGGARHLHGRQRRDPRDPQRWNQLRGLRPQEGLVLWWAMHLR